MIKNYAKSNIKVCSSCPILLDFLTLFHIFFGGIVTSSLCDVLRELVPFVQFKKREKLLHGYFPRFLNYTNGTKSRNVSHIFRSDLLHLFVENSNSCNFADGNIIYSSGDHLHILCNLKYMIQRLLQNSLDKFCKRKSQRSSSKRVSLTILLNIKVFKSNST